MRRTKMILPVLSGLLLLSTGCFLEDLMGGPGSSGEGGGSADAGAPAPGPGDGMWRPDGGACDGYSDDSGCWGEDPGSGADCWDEFDACAQAVDAAGEDTLVCAAILDGCDSGYDPRDPGDPTDPGYDPGHGACPPDEQICRDEFEACLMACEPDGAPLCEEQFAHCLGDVGEPLPVDPCAEEYDSCLASGMDPAECDDALRSCEPSEPPPVDPCFEDYDSCLASGMDPAECESALAYCPPDVGGTPADPECLSAYEDCIFWTDDPMACEPILSACFAPEPAPAPADPSCGDAYDRCLWESSFTGDDPASCEALLYGCLPG